MGTEAEAGPIPAGTTPVGPTAASQNCSQMARVLLEGTTAEMCEMP